jgi:hypothetical protein
MWGDAKLWAVLETGGNDEGPMATTIGAVQSLLPGACSLAWTRDRVASSPMKPTRWVSSSGPHCSNGQTQINDPNFFSINSIQSEFEKYKSNLPGIQKKFQILPGVR